MSPSKYKDMSIGNLSDCILSVVLVLNVFMQTLQG